MATKVSTFKGIDIFVDEGGKFSATVEGRTIKRASLKAVTTLKQVNNKNFETVQAEVGA